MVRVTRALARGGATGAIAALAIALPAHAAGDKLECTEEGSVKFAPALPFVGGTGSFTFNDHEVVCSGVEKMTNPVVVQLTLHTEGVYQNVVCGTGKWDTTYDSIRSQVTLVGSPKTDFAALFGSGKLKRAYELIGSHGFMYFHDPWVNRDKSPVPAPKPLGDPYQPKPDGHFAGNIDAFYDWSKDALFPATCTKSVWIVAHFLLET